MTNFEWLAKYEHNFPAGVWVALRYGTLLAYRGNRTELEAVVKRSKAIRAGWDIADVFFWKIGAKA